MVGPDATGLAQDARAAVARLETAPGLRAVGCAACRVRPSMQVELDPASLGALGVSSADVALAMPWRRPRRVATLDAGGAVPIDVTLTVGDGGVDGWLELPVVTRGGAVVRLSDVAALRTGEEPDELLHVDGVRAATVWAQGRPGVAAAEVRALLARELPQATIVPADLRAIEAEPW